MRKVILGTLLAMVGTVALAGTGASASVTCGPGAPGGFNAGQSAYVRVSYPTGGDLGRPGLFWLGIISPDQTSGAVLTGQGWVTYQGGLYPFQARYDNGLPGTITLEIPFPNNAVSTAGYVGHSVYVGHGAYTVPARQKVADRRAVLDAAKPEMVARGRWRPEFASDEQYIWSLVQKDMTENKKYGAVLTVPNIDCTPSNP